MAVLNSPRLTQGPEVEAFEDDFAKAVGALHAVSFSSGTAALHAALQAVGLTGGQELVTSGLTFVASANAGLYCGAKVRFADIDETWNVSADTVGECLGMRTGAVCVTHFAGHPAPVRQIRERVGDIPIVEDACHALGSPGVGACQHSEITCFSLHPAKAITAGEGGMATTRSADLAMRMRRFRNHGFKIGEGWHREQVNLGYNYRLSDIHAALGRSQLRKLERHIALRTQIAALYQLELRGVEYPPNCPDHSWHLYVIRHPERDRLYEALREKGIETQVHYLPLYRNRVHMGAWLPGVEAYFQNCLSLPIFPGLSDTDQAKVIEAVNEF